MSLEPPDVIDTDDLTDADEQILDALHNGQLTKGAIVDETGLHRNTVGNRLDALKFGDAIEAVHERTALYRLVDDPRDDVEPAPEPADLQERIDELESDLADAREDIEHYRDELEDCRDRLANAPDRQELARTIEDLEAACERDDSSDAKTALERLKEAAGVDGEP